MLMRWGSSVSSCVYCMGICTATTMYVTVLDLYGYSVYVCDCICAYVCVCLCVCVCVCVCVSVLCVRVCVCDTWSTVYSALSNLMPTVNVKHVAVQCKATDQILLGSFFKCIHYSSHLQGVQLAMRPSNWNSILLKVFGGTWQQVTPSLKEGSFSTHLTVRNP